MQDKVIFRLESSECADLSHMWLSRLSKHPAYFVFPIHSYSEWNWSKNANRSLFNKNDRASCKKYVCKICNLQVKFYVHQSAYFCVHVCETLRFKSLLPYVPFYNPHENIWKLVVSTRLLGERKRISWADRLTFDARHTRNICIKPRC